MIGMVDEAVVAAAEEEEENTHNKSIFVSVLVGFMFSTNTETIAQHTGKSQAKIHKQVALTQPIAYTQTTKTHNEHTTHSRSKRYNLMKERKEVNE